MAFFVRYSASVVQYVAGLEEDFELSETYPKDFDNKEEDNRHHKIKTHLCFIHIMLYLIR